MISFIWNVQTRQMIGTESRLVVVRAREIQKWSMNINGYGISSFLFFFTMHLQHMGVLRLGVKSELELLAYTTATATQDPSHICGLHNSSWQHWSLTHWVRPGIEPTSSWILVRFIIVEPQWELPPLLIFFFCTSFLVFQILTNLKLKFHLFQSCQYLHRIKVYLGSSLMA